MNLFGIKERFYNSDAEQVKNIKSAEVVYFINKFLYLEIEIKKDNLKIIKDILFSSALDKRLFKNPKHYDVLYFINESLIDSSMCVVYGFFYNLKNEKIPKNTILITHEILSPLSQKDGNLVGIFDDKIILYQNKNISYISTETDKEEDIIKYIKSIYSNDIKIVRMDTNELIKYNKDYLKYKNDLPNLIKKDSASLFSIKHIIYICVILLSIYPIFLLIQNGILKYRLNQIEQREFTQNKKQIELYNHLEHITQSKISLKMPLLKSIFNELNKHNISLSEIKLSEQDGRLHVALIIIAQNEQDINLFASKNYEIKNISPSDTHIIATLHREIKSK